MSVLLDSHQAENPVMGLPAHRHYDGPDYHYDTPGADLREMERNFQRLANSYDVAAANDHWDVADQLEYDMQAEVRDIRAVQFRLHPFAY